MSGARRAAARGDDRVHVVIYFDAETAGGAEILLSQVIAGLPDRFRITAVSVDRIFGDDIVRWVAGHRPGTEHLLMDPIAGARDFRHMWEHRQMFVSLRPDIIHFNLSAMSLCQWALATALTIPKVPVIAVENSPQATWTKASTRLKKVTSSRLDAHLAVGNKTARIVEETVGLRAGSVGTLYHGVAQPATDVPREPYDGPLIVNVARHDPVKGVDLMLQAMTLLPDDVHLVQIGSGNETASLLALRHELGLDDRVEFRELPLGDPAADHIAGFDLFVLTSRLEGLPVTIMEAMLAGRAVVAPDVGSVREEVIDGETGLVVPPNDPAAVAAAVEELLADPDRREEMARKGQARAREMFTVDATVDRYVALWDRMLAARSR
jgi:glycosyltransferase involved in cell wall biosynthesis